MNIYKHDPPPTFPKCTFSDAANNLQQYCTHYKFFRHEHQTLNCLFRPGKPPYLSRFAWDRVDRIGEGFRRMFGVQSPLGWGRGVGGCHAMPTQQTYFLLGRSISFKTCTGYPKTSLVLLKMDLHIIGAISNT